MITMQPLDAKLSEAFQVQYTRERMNRDAYTDLAEGFVALGLDGLAKWMRHAAAEEGEHAARIADYLTDKRWTKAQTRATPAQDFQFTDPVAAFEQAMRLEAETTELVLSLYAMAEDAEDADACLFLHWFIAEQRESEAQIKNIIGQFRATANVLLMDARLGGA